MKVFIASDHAGLAAKRELIDRLRDEYDIDDLGPKEFDKDDDYPKFAAMVGRAVVDNPQSAGILICRSGQGMEIAANKVRGVRAALVWNEVLARETRRDNDSNVLSLPAGELTVAQMAKISRCWLDTPFSGEVRHQRRIDQISDLEQKQ